MADDFLKSGTGMGNIERRSHRYRQQSVTTFGAGRDRWTASANGLIQVSTGVQVNPFHQFLLMRIMFKSPPSLKHEVEASKHVTERATEIAMQVVNAFRAVRKGHFRHNLNVLVQIIITSRVVDRDVFCSEHFLDPNGREWVLMHMQLIVVTFKNAAWFKGEGG